MSRRSVAARVPWLGRETGEVPYDRPAPRQTITYHCEHGHAFEVVFAAGPAVAVPDGWPCRCGGWAGTAPPDLEKAASQHHMRLVRQRRTDAELEEILAEAIACIRQGQL